MAVRVDAAGNLVGQLAGLRPRRRDAAARLPPRHGARRGRVRRPAGRDGRDRVRRAAAGARGQRCRSPSTCSASATRRGCASAPPTSAAARVAGTLDARAARRCVDDDGVDAARGAGGVRRRAGRIGARRGAASGCSATSSCTSSRGRCSRSATRRSASSTAIAGATRAEVRFAGRAGHAGTVPMDAAPRRRLRRSRSSCSRSRPRAARRRGWSRRSAAWRRCRARRT